MKQNRARHLLLGAIGFLMALSLSGPPVCAQESEIPDEIADTPPEDTEYDHYSDPGGIQPYASPLNGSMDNIIVFVRFKGEPEYVTSAGIANSQKIYNTGEHSLKEYLKRISYGTIDINTHFYPTDSTGNYYSVEVSKSAGYYKKQSTGSSEGYTTEEERTAREQELITEAFRGVKTQLESSSLNLDGNGDGKIDAISFVVSVTNPNIEYISHGDLLWPHEHSLSINETITTGGKTLTVSTYNLVNKGNDSIGIFGKDGSIARTVKHEFLHTLSLPDLYRYGDSAAQPLGPWDIMDQGNTAHITSWYQREYLEFGSGLPVYTSSVQGLTLNTAKYTDPNEVYSVILKSPVNPNEYFVVENRAIDLDDNGQKNAGLLVYRIRATGTPSDGNSQGPPDFIYAFRPNESSLNAGDGDIGYATLSPDNEKGFTSLGKPLGGETPGYDNGTIYYTDGSNSGIVIDNLIRNADDSVTFDVTFPESLKGDGTQDSPYELCTFQDLYLLSSSTDNTYYRIMKDINLDGIDFMPIEQFKGILDGNGKTISNLNVSGKGEIGFIKNILLNAVVKNLVFSNPTLYSSSNYAGIFPTVQGTLENITIIGGSIVSDPDSYSSRAGGLAGALDNPGIIRNCYTSAAVSANIAGGLISYLNGGTIENSYACGNVSGSGTNLVTGGILAYWSQSQIGTINNTYWDIQGSGQITNGKIADGSTPAVPPSCYGIKLDCPGSVEKDANANASIVSDSGTVPAGGTWESSDSSVISVNASTGSMTGQKAGTASISYRFPVGSYSAALTADVTCTDPNGGDTGGDSGNTGGDSGNTGGDSGNTGGDSGNTGGDSGNTGGDSGNTGGDSGNTGGDSSNTGSDSGNTGGDSGNTGNDSTDKGDNIPVLDNGSWIASGGRWWFRSTDGSYPSGGIYSINGSNFAFDSNGWMITGWYQKDGYWYYFNGSGYMHKGWLLLNRTWYYLNPADGRMLADGIHSVGGSSFAFYGSGAMVTGWYHASDGNWYYFNGSGYMHTGWILLGGTWYYLNPANGQMLADGIHSVGGSSFAFYGSGAMVTGWYHASDGNWYYFSGSGHMHTGWILLGGTWYYLNPANGQMLADGIHSVSGSSFAFYGSGAMVTGWYLASDGSWYYFNGSGYMHKGWILLGNTWYYLNPADGKMYADEVVSIDGRNSSFSASGAWLGYAD